MPITNFVQEINSSVQEGIRNLKSSEIPELDRNVELSKEKEEELDKQCDAILFQSGPWDKEFTLEIYQFMDQVTYYTISLIKRTEFKRLEGEYREVITWIDDSLRFWAQLKNKYGIKEVKTFITSRNLERRIKNIYG